MAFVVRLEGHIWAFLQELAIRPVMGAGMVVPVTRPSGLLFVLLGNVSPCPKALRAGLTAPRCVCQASPERAGLRRRLRSRFVSDDVVDWARMGLVILTGTWTTTGRMGPS